MRLFRNTKQHLDVVLEPFGMEVRDGWEVGFRGEWARAPHHGRNTLTQLSSKHCVFAQCGSAPFTHVMQLELSLTLRKMLNSKRQFREAFARALAAAAFTMQDPQQQQDHQQQQLSQVECRANGGNPHGGRSTPTTVASAAL